MSVKLIKVRESQWNFGVGWTHRSPTTGHTTPWTTEKGRACDDIYSMKLDGGWEWDGDWKHLRLGASDKEGWRYGKDFESLERAPMPHAPNSWVKAVRQRVWQRKCRRTSTSARSDRVVATKQLRHLSDTELSKQMALLQSHTTTIEKKRALVGTSRDSRTVRHDLTKAIREAKACISTTRRALKSADRKVKSSKRAGDFEKLSVPVATESISKAEAAMDEHPESALRSAGAGSARRGHHHGHHGAGAGAFAAAEDSELHFDGVGTEEIDARMTDTAFEDEIAINARIIAEREGELTGIQRDAVQIRSLFNDVSTLIDEQEKPIESIVDAVTEAEARTRKGVDDLEKAREEQRSSCAIM